MSSRISGCPIRSFETKPISPARKETTTKPIAGEIFRTEKKKSSVSKFRNAPVLEWWRLISNEADSDKFGDYQAPKLVLRMQGEESTGLSIGFNLLLVYHCWIDDGGRERRRSDRLLDKANQNWSCRDIIW